MEAVGFCSCSGGTTATMLAASSTRMGAGGPPFVASSSLPPPSLARAMATQKSATGSGGTRKMQRSTVFPVDEPAREARSSAPPVRLLTNVEKLRLLTKAEKAGLLSAAEKNFGLSLSTVEKFGLLSKAEELGVLSAATDPRTPGALSALGLALLVIGPVCVYVVPEQYPWEVALQVVVALICVVGGSAAFAASNFVSNLQRSS